MSESGELGTRRRARAAVRVREVADREVRGILWGRESTAVLLEEGLDRIRDGEATPYSVSSSIVRDLLESGHFR